MLTREIHIAARKVACLVLSVDVGKAHECCLVGLETVLVDEERHKYAVHIENEVVGIGAVEHVIVEMKRHLAIHAMRFAYLAYTVDSFFLYHYQKI